MSEQIAVLTLGAEGGRIRLLASGPAGRCTYRLEIRDSTAAFLNEEDRADPISRTPAAAGDWDAALAMLDRECPHWAKLSPLAVHPDFVTRLRAAVEGRCEGRTLDRWRTLLEPAS